MNVSFSSLLFKNNIEASPMRVIADNIEPGRLSFARCQVKRSLGSLFYMQGLASTALRSSYFESFLTQVFSIESTLKQVTSQQDYTEEFSINIEFTVFKDIKANERPGAAFYAVSELHMLEMTDSIIDGCYSDVTAPFTRAKRNMGAGAFLFVGTLSKLLRNCISHCSAKGNAQAFYTEAKYKGSNSNGHMLAYQNGGKKVKGHSLFIMDMGNTFLSGSNISFNTVPGGYAGGYLGWFAYSAIVEFSRIYDNIGETIIGLTANSPGGLATLMYSEFYRNEVTEGVIVRLPPKLIINNIFLGCNLGSLFYGSAPIDGGPVYSDAKFELGDFDGVVMGLNFELRTYAIKVFEKCPE